MFQFGKSPMAEVVRLPRSSWLRSVIASTATTSESWEVLQNEICLVIRAYIERHEKQSHGTVISFCANNVDCVPAMGSG